MKKKFLNFLALVMVGCMLTGCGKEEPGTESQEVGESSEAVQTTLDVAEVTLGKYKGLEVSLAPVSVEQSTVDLMVAEAYNSVVTAENGGITERAVANGDTANIDYVGKKDGVAFDGGTAEGYNLIIGSGRFIDGFEEGLIGVMPGDTVDLNLTFPEDYGNEELSGAEVVFTVTVNYILPEEKDWQDSVVSSIGIEGVDTIEKLRDYAYDYYYESAMETYNTTLQNSLLRDFLDACVFTNVPRQYLENYRVVAQNMVEQNAAAYGMDVDTFCNTYYAMTADEFVAQYSEETARQEVALRELAKQENLTITDEELETILSENAAAQGYSSVDEFLGDTSRDTYKSYLICQRALQFMVDNAVINNE